MLCFSTSFFSAWTWIWWCTSAGFNLFWSLKTLRFASKVEAPWMLGEREIERSSRWKITKKKTKQGRGNEKEEEKTVRVVPKSPDTQVQNIIQLLKQANIRCSYFLSFSLCRTNRLINLNKESGFKFENTLKTQRGEIYGLTHKWMLKETVNLTLPSSQRKVPEKSD